VQPQVNDTPVMSLDDDEVEQLQFLEDNAVLTAASVTPPEIRAQKFYFPRCFRDTVELPRAISPDKILAYDSQGDDD